jgi:enoyl-CoA hydratase/carnithine racemase
MKHVIYEKKGYKAYIILNKPEKLNALDGEMYQDVLSCLKKADADDGVRVVIMKGAGRCYSAGYDIQAEMGRVSTPMEERNGFRDGSNACRWMMWDMGKAVISQIHGYCLGGAFELAMPADYVIASDDCQIGEPQVSFGAASLYLMMPWLAGIRKGKELMLTGEKVNGKQAEEYGIVTKSVPAEELDAYVEDLADRIIKMPPELLAVQKWGINRQYEVMGFKTGLDTWVDYTMFYRFFETPEIKEFSRISKEQGTKAALKWRDDYFAGKATISEESLK